MNQLFAVANQCPLTGGNAVFRARSLYSLIDDALEYDDAMLCLQQGLITKRTNVESAPIVYMVPNPANEVATLVLDKALSEPGVLTIHGA